MSLGRNEAEGNQDFEVKTSLGTLSEHFVCIDRRVTLGSVTIVRVKSARVTAIWIGDSYMR